MSTHIDLVDNNNTDKNTTHSYLQLYEQLLNSRRERARAVMEVGVANGGSIALWHNYFPNAQVHGLDLQDNLPALLANYQKDYPRMTIHLKNDAYTNEMINKLKVYTEQFDFVLDDGPHSLESMMSLIKLYAPLLTSDGILIIEDVQDPSWFEHLKTVVPAEMASKVRTFDLRPNKGRYDDLVFVIDRSLP